MSEEPGNIAKNDDQTTWTGAGNPMEDKFIGFELASRYKILELIGTGGWGNVYLGRHLTLGTDVAIKIIHTHLSRDEGNLKRLEQEAKLLNRLESPYIVRIIDYAIEPFPYIVMEYFDGIPLSTWLKQHGPLEFGMALELFTQISDGMSNAMELGLVHRDLKPGNVLIKIEENKLRSKILDFGIAKLIEDSAGTGNLTTTDEILGSPPFMSPEQWTGKTDHRSDIYSFGCIMYETLTGKPAFTAQYGMDYLNKHLSEYPLRMQKVKSGLRIPDALEDIVRKCIQKSPAKRYQTSAALKADLEQVKAGRKIKIRLPQENKLLSAKSLAIAVSVVTLSGAALWYWHEPLLTAQCQALNLEADKAKASGKAEKAIEKYRQTIMFAHYLPRQNKQKLHAMRKLVFLLKERKEWHESAALEKEVDLLIGKMTPEFQAKIARIDYYRDIADYKTADKLARQAMASAIASSGEHSMAYSWAIDAEGSNLRKKGYRRRALECYLHSLKIAEDLREPVDPVLADRLNNLGIAFHELGQNENSERSYLQSITMFTELGMFSEVASVQNSLATLYYKMGKVKLSLENYRKSLELGEKYNGSNVASTLSNIAEVYSATKEPDKAIEYFNKSLDLRKKQNSDQNLDTEYMLAALSKMYIEKKDFKNAESCLERAFTIAAKQRPNPKQETVLLTLQINAKRGLGKVLEAKVLQDRLDKLLEAKGSKT